MSSSASSTIPSASSTIPSASSTIPSGKKDLGKKYGEWYGPSSVAYVLKYCVDKAKREGVREVKNFVIYAATDCMREYHLAL